MLWDSLSRSGNGPQQQLQPALLPDQKGRQRLLEGGAALGKFDFHAHAAHAKAVRIDGPFHKPGHIVRDFHIFILGVPVVKVAQIDGWPDGTKRMRDMSKNTALKSISVLLEAGLITVEPSSYFDRRGMKWKGNNLYTILPIHSAVGILHQRQLRKLELDVARSRLAAQTTV